MLDERRSYLERKVLRLSSVTTQTCQAKKYRNHIKSVERFDSETKFEAIKGPDMLLTKTL